MEFQQDFFVLLSIILIIPIIALFFGIPTFIIYKLIKRLIRYNAEYKSKLEDSKKTKQDSSNNYKE